MPRMRGGRSWAARVGAVVLGACGVAFATSFAACARTAAAAGAEADVLVLELGGGHDSLRAALARRGLLRRDPRAAAERRELEEVPLADPRRSPAPVEPVAPPAAEPQWIEVRLARGETLMHVAKKHLGTARRYRELMTLNGWTEDDARRLRDGTLVKVPKPAR